jgi:hypothetical protein
MNDTISDAPIQPRSHRAWNYVLFFVLGTLFGVILTGVLFGPQINRMLDASIADAGKRTLLFDPPANNGLAIAGTPMTEVYSGNRATPLVGYPRWIIVGKVKPTIAGAPMGAKYSYYDPQTNQYDGPYVPEAPALRQ